MMFTGSYYEKEFVVIHNMRLLIDNFNKIIHKLEAYQTEVHELDF